MAKSPAPALTRGLAIVEMIAQQHEAVGFNRIMEKLELPRATCARLLQVLRDEGWIAREEVSGKYLAGSRLRTISTQATVRHRLSVEAQGILEHASRLTGNTVTLFYFNGTTACALAKVMHPESLVMQEVGNVSVPSTCPWWLYFLHAMPEAEREACIPEKFKADIAALWPRFIAFIADHPYWVERSSLPGANRMAVPVLGADGAVVAALGIAGTQLSLPDDRIDTIGRQLAEHAKLLQERIAV